jgi:hypothetical protein
MYACQPSAEAGVSYVLLIGMHRHDNNPEPLSTAALQMGTPWRLATIKPAVAFRFAKP